MPHLFHVSSPRSWNSGEYHQIDMVANSRYIVRYSAAAEGAFGKGFPLCFDFAIQAAAVVGTGKPRLTFDDRGENTTVRQSRSYFSKKFFKKRWLPVEVCQPRTELPGREERHAKTDEEGYLHCGGPLSGVLRTFVKWCHERESKYGLMAALRYGPKPSIILKQPHVAKRTMKPNAETHAHLAR